MRYRIRYRARAKAELKSEVRVYGQHFDKQINDWLADLSELPESDSSIDVQDVMEQFEKSSWQESFKYFRNRGYWEQLKAAVEVMLKRRPPLEVRGSMRWIELIMDSLPTEIQIYYQVDHVNKQLIVVKFDGFPGQE